MLVCAATGLAVWPPPGRSHLDAWAGCIVCSTQRAARRREQLDGERVEVDLLAQVGG
jgi:hypothetical protein